MRAAPAMMVLLLVAGCGDDDGAADGSDGDGDGDGDGDADAGDGGADCVAWELAEAQVVTLSKLDPGPYNPERSLRVGMQTLVGGCDERAMTEVTYDSAAATATIRPRLWHQASGGCNKDGEEKVTRPVLLLLDRPGTWTVSAGAESLTVEVEEAPARPCGSVEGKCEMDCDCARGDLCLSATGLGGAFTQCARPCELDHDCGGNGRCEYVPDGLSFTCSSGAECGPEAEDATCPDGWTCAGGACTPGFTLDQSTRGECSCDADCDAPLRCALGDGGAGRCEIACPTDGPWCQGAHACGLAAADLAGLALTDSVCVSLGE